MKKTPLVPSQIEVSFTKTKFANPIRIANSKLITVAFLLFATATCRAPAPKDSMASNIPKEVFVQRSTASETFVIPEKQNTKMSLHGETRVDPYFWMKQRDTQPVFDYLNSENRRTQLSLEPTIVLQETLYKEFRARVKENDQSVPIFKRGFWYYSKHEQGKEYPIFCRRKGTMQSAEQVMIDGNMLSLNHSYFKALSPSVSQSTDIIAYSIDTEGRRFYDIRFKDLSRKTDLPDLIKDTTGDVEWSADNKTLFYVKQDPTTLRAFQLFKYQLGSGKSELVYEEKDSTFSIDLQSDKLGRRIWLQVSETNSSEWRYIPSENPNAKWTVLAPREPLHEYDIEDTGDRLFVRTNWNAPNFRVMSVELGKTAKKNWREVVAHKPEVYISSVDAFKNYLVLSERSNGLSQLHVHDIKKSKDRWLKFNEPTYTVSYHELADFESPVFRFEYESLHQPEVIYEERFDGTGRVAKKKRQIEGFKPSEYESTWLMATASDGTKIPISLLQKKPLKGDTRAPGPLLLYGYGSYGSQVDPTFQSNMISLVDRGFRYAIAHIRGGSEMGRTWYDQGRLANKMNTFTDFISAGEFLVSENYTSKDRLHIMGESAGGLLIGAVVNLRPDLFRSAVAGVPFVDVLTTMLDETIPLTTGEYSEWGDPRKKADYDIMRAYSPYDNIAAKAYPHLYIYGGYHDSQVQYWEPAKWAAKLRDMKTNNNLLLLDTEMGSGHGGPSGRFNSLKNDAKHLAFFLMLEGILK
jgi:oligopeptidase B